MGIAALAPLMALIVIFIKSESSGPALFCQRRSGYAGKPFVIYKFRTMKVTEDDDVIVQASRNDTRFTRVGRFLRRSSLDELPQLINVLMGDMTLVGPRPHALAHDREYLQKIPSYSARFTVKPGMTGLAQVNGFRGETRHVETMRKRILLDAWYARNWSLQLDLKILLRTPYELFKANAY